MNLVEAESEKYRDIVQFSIIDNYLKITVTRLLSYYWLVENCKHKFIYVKSDADFYINAVDVMSKQYNFIINTKKPTGAGFILKKSGPIRNPYHKNSIFKELYPEDIYPPYLSGCFSYWTSSALSIVFIYLFYRH